jgi:cellulose synthase/poly-beta-1,6-N-acetylglucosamine synthase-like glycosyltransferase
VLIPAHNEETTLPRTLASIQTQLSPTSRILVVADNCSDQTSRVAHRAGVEVLERHDDLHHGKGYALAFGIEWLKTDPPDVLIIVDADTQLQPGALVRLQQAAITTGRPCQAVNLLSPPDRPTRWDWISTFAFRVRNLVRPLGNSVLGIPCPLLGNGMAIPWPVLDRVSLATANIVEDVQLGIDLTIAGFAPCLVREGRVSGTLPASTRSASAQRRRWEHGRLATIVRQVPRLVVEAVRQQRWELLWMAFDTAVPPLALVVMLVSLLSVVAIALTVVGQLWWPALVSLSAALLLALAIGTAWRKFGRDIPGSALLVVPLYVLCKLPMYAAFVVQRQRQWVRTDRQTSTCDASPLKRSPRSVSLPGPQSQLPAFALRWPRRGVLARWLGHAAPWPLKSSHRL